MKHKYYKDLNENVYFKTLDNGLKVYLIPKPDFFKTVVTFTTNYGSMDLSFIPLNRTRRVNQPEGIAHFLEHKLFAMPDGSDAFEKLSSLGVVANAFTSIDKTAYLFSGTENIKEALIYLLDYVQMPYFTNSNVKKEQGIIEEEIFMNFDSPERIIFNTLMEQTYKNHPIKYHVLGTKESIYKITKTDLYNAYNTFYHPSNMHLIIAGNFDVDEIIKIVEDNQNSKDYKKINPVKSIIPFEPLKVVKTHDESEANVTLPLVGLNVKLKSSSKVREQYKKIFVIEILLNLYFSKGSSLYTNLLKKGLINNSFDMGSIVSTTSTAMQVSSYTNDPEEFLKVIKRTLIGLKRRNIDEELFEVEKRSLYGLYIRSLNSVGGINRSYINSLAFDVDLFDVPELINEITINDLEELAKEIKSEYITSHILRGKKD